MAFHNAQLEAAAFREEFDPDQFVDLTIPNSKAIHKVNSWLCRRGFMPVTELPLMDEQKAGESMQAWKKALQEEKASELVDTAVAGSKRKAVSGPLVSWLEYEGRGSDTAYLKGCIRG